MTFHTALALEDALRQLAAGARAVAGGTDLFPALGDGPDPARLVDLSGLADLRGIGRTATGWRIGAATTWTDIAGAALPRAFDGLRAAARAVGSVQIQNAGTIGGNLCNASPAADGVPPLMALDAGVVIAGADGMREMPLGDFLRGPRRTALAPGEIMVAVTVPDPAPNARSVFVKLGARRYMVISVAMVAATLWTGPGGRIAGGRVAVGACSPVAQRLPALEAALCGRLPDGLAGVDLTVPGLFAGLVPIDDVRGAAGYRRAAVPELVRRALVELASDG